MSSETRSSVSETRSSVSETGSLVSHNPKQLVNIILLTGLAGSGKDSSADYIIKTLNSNGITAIKLGLADRLKYICQHLIKLFYGIVIPIEEFYDPIQKERIRLELPLFNGQPFKIRSVLQMVGSEVFREFLWGDIWCEYIEKTFITNLSCKYQVIIISDCRFPNEVNYFKQMLVRGQIQSCESYRIIRPNRNQLTDGNQNHQSEIHINDLIVDHEINNTGSLPDLYDKLSLIISSLKP